MWLIFALIAGTLFLFSGLTEVHNLGIFDNYYDYAIVGLCALVTIILTITLAILFDNLLPQFADNVKKMWCAIGFIVGIAAVIVFRVLVFDGIIASIDNSGIITQYYGDSVIGSGGAVYASLSSVGGIYNWIVSCVFRFLGNSGTGLYLCEQAMMLIAFILIYFAVRMLCGGFEGFIYLLTVSVLPAFVIHGEYYSVYVLEYLIFAKGLFFVALTIWLADKKVANYISVIVVSIGLGVMFAYTDLGPGLIVVMCAMTIACKESGIVYRILSPILTILLSGLAFVCTTCFDAVTSGDINRLSNELVSIANYRFVGDLNENLFFELSNETYFLIILFLAIAYIVMYLKSKQDRARHIILLLICSLGIYCYMPTVNGYACKLIIISLFAIIAGSAIGQIFINGKKDLDDEIESEAEAVVVDDAEAKTTSVTVASVEIEANTEDKVVTEAVVVSEEPQAEASIEYIETIEEPKVELFESPLPLPKKAVKRDVEYDFDVPEDLMHYDIEVFDNL